MKFENQPFKERVRIWFGPNPVAEITASLSSYEGGTRGLHLTNGNGAFAEPGEPPVGIAISRSQDDSVSWVRFHMVHEGVAYVEEMHVSGWNDTRVGEEAQAWRRSVQRGEKETQRIGAPAS